MIHPTAEVERGAQVGADTRIWHFVHIRTGAKIGDNCTIGYNVLRRPRRASSAIT